MMIVAFMQQLFSYCDLPKFALAFCQQLFMANLFPCQERGIIFLKSVSSTERALAQLKER